MAAMMDIPPRVLSDALPHIPLDWLRRRRWFSSKGRSVEAITAEDWGALPLDQPGVIALACVHYTGGRKELYFLPLMAGREAEPAGVNVPAALTVDHEGEVWYVHDAFQFHAFRRLLASLLIEGATLPLAQGQLRFSPEEPLRQSPPPLEEIKLVTAEQSNSSIIYDRQVILKCFRRVVAGVNPDVEVSRFLTAMAGFRHTPAMLGSIAYLSRDGVEHSLGVLQSFVPNEGDAWEHTLVELGRFLAAVRYKDRFTEEVLLRETRRLAAPQFDRLAQLGALTGELHCALASGEDDPDFAPRPLQPEQVAAWQDAIRAERDAILGALEQRAAHLPPEQQEAVRGLLASRARIEQRIAQLHAIGDAGLVTTRYHGDYHLGQILVTQDGFLILDFEGEPLRSLAERRAHGSPLKDVAGMLRSLSYAAFTALTVAESRGVGASDRGEMDEHMHPQLAGWTDAWERLAREAFLSGYIEATRDTPFIPREPELLNTAIAVFELEKALYELNYELNNRPDWLPIPLHGIQRVI